MCNPANGPVLSESRGIHTYCKWLNFKKTEDIPVIVQDLHLDLSTDFAFPAQYAVDRFLR